MNKRILKLMVVCMGIVLCVNMRAIPNDRNGILGTDARRIPVGGDSNVQAGSSGGVSADMIAMGRAFGPPRFHLGGVWTTLDFVDETAMAAWATFDFSVDETAMALDQGTDPHRYGPILINQLTHQDRKDAQALVARLPETTFLMDLQSETQSDALNLWDYKEYPSNRIKIAKAIMCGERSKKFISVAISKNDHPLVEILLKEGVNPNERSDSYIGWLVPLVQAKTVAIAQLLVQYGASMKVDNHETLLHHACQHDYPPDLLAYYIGHAGIDINDKYLQGDTPLHTWARYPLMLFSGEHLLTDAQQKLALLLKAGAALDCKDKNGLTPLDILKKERKKWVYDTTFYKNKIDAYDMLIAQLSAAMPSNSMPESTNEQSCAICLDDEASPSFCTLNCKYTFHTACVKLWLKQNRTCPICRRKQ